ncbi:hypothetical protein IscW_ISCW010737 [Ixodes scapularis]|uniref:Ig-like domain-containing protein n=1 Tax=Ixodes scapularis TaxID=6945 RepID=B7Q5S6_IXOSC|nr:hypothetical protein IscW_ISCW010737 [Ixodes scapularis]|eukprot:XP_002402219.1 hypothetical protein IscW_ISCW010737 [Ixodes scapularis]
MRLLEACHRVRKGEPNPSITWFRNGEVIANTSRASARGNIRSDAVIPRLYRSDLLSTFSCQVSNNISAPVVSAVKLEMILNSELRKDSPLCGLLHVHACKNDRTKRGAAGQDAMRTHNAAQDYRR